LLSPGSGIIPRKNNMANSLFRKKSIAQIQADAASGFSDAELVPGQPGEGHTTLRRSLGTFDLTMLGIAAIIGAGIFAMVGQASYNGGPGVVILFVFAAIACGFAALCYAEFASKIPIAGSAYTYAYASFGELLAWIIGWDLLVEYAIGNIAVAISWSDYFTGLLEANGIHIPLNWTMDFRSAHLGFEKVSEAMAGGAATAEGLRAVCDAKDAAVSCGALDAFDAWVSAPQVGGIPMIADIPALGDRHLYHRTRLYRHPRVKDRVEHNGRPQARRDNARYRRRSLLRQDDQLAPVPAARLWRRDDRCRRCILCVHWV
jgi:APA family basic amino acid/polyamine antiporter